MTTPCPIQHARLASALVQTFTALEAGDTKRAAHSVQRFLNKAISMEDIDLQMTLLAAYRILEDYR